MTLACSGLAPVNTCKEPREAAPSVRQPRSVLKLENRKIPVKFSTISSGFCLMI